MKNILKHLKPLTIFILSAQLLGNEIDLNSVLADTKKTKNPNNAAMENKTNFTLNKMLQEIIATDPEIKERLHQYKSIVEEIKMSKAGYYPTVDVVGKSGYKTAEKTDQEKDKYDYSELTLSVVQNIFNGFGTMSAVNRDEARAKAAFNKYIEVAQDKMYNAIEAYLKVLRYGEVLKIAKDNVKLHEETLLKIEKRYNEGFSTLSEVERVKGRVSLAKSNYVSETNNLYDAKFNFHRALGRFVHEKNLSKPEFTSTLPKRLEEAQDIAIHNNPSILVANNDIKVMQESLQYAKKSDYPTLDLELEASRYNNLDGSSDAREDDVSALLVLRYNLYNGGSDIAEKQKYISLLNYEYEHKNTLKRQVIESLGLSWNAYKMIAEQYKYQIQYRDLTNKTQAAYSEEFQLGRRTLIDLLDVQDELNSIRIKVIHSTYDLLFSKYRIMDGTGELYKMFADVFKENYEKDEILAYVDQDKDNILDVEDQCDNSAVSNTNIYGCEDINCIKVDKIEFNKEIGTDVEEVDTTAIETLWGVK
jgi:adhesin transport system outer membrane protein